MPSRLPPCRRDQSRVPSLQRVLLHACTRSTDPSDSLPTPCDFSRPALYPRSLPDLPARYGLSCSALLFPNVPPPETPERSSTRSGPGCCLLPSPRHDRLGPLEHLSADNMTWLQRSLVVAARWFAPLCFKGFRHSAWLGRISPPGWSLLPGAPALTRTGLAPARTTRLSGRTMTHIVPRSPHGFSLFLATFSAYWRSGTEPVRTACRICSSIIAFYWLCTTCACTGLVIVSPF